MLKIKNHIGIIIIASLLIPVLANLNLITQIFTLSQAEALSMIKKEEFEFIRLIGFKNILSELMILVLLVFFNYAWKDILIPQKLRGKKRITLIILGNLILLVALISFEYVLEKQVSPVSVNLKSFNLGNYFLKHLSVLLIAFILPYLLLRMRRIEFAERTLTQIKEEKAKAELAALKEQISPHFFFNTLSTLSTIVRNENQAAVLAYIQDMSDTYRYTLSSAREDLVPLKEEVAFVKAYVYLVEKRLGDKLQVELDMKEDYPGYMIPPMSLQLLIENAIQHNVITTALPLRIHIYIEGNQICVENNLQAKEEVESFGIGLNNLNNRYKLLMNQEILIEKNSTTFTVKLPLL